MKKASVMLSFLNLSLITIFFIHCSGRENHYGDLKKLKKPNTSIDLAAPTVVNKIELFAPSDIEIVGDHLILIDHKADEVIKIIDLGSNDLITSFGRTGQGPNEFIGASQILRDQEDRAAFWIYDIATRFMKKFDLNELIVGKHEPKAISRLRSEKIGVPNHLRFSPGGELLAVGLFFKGRIAVYERNLDSFDYFEAYGEIPVESESLPTQHSHGYQSTIALTDNGRIYVATRLGTVVEKYDTDGKLISTLIGPEAFFPEYRIVPAGDNYTMTYNENTRFGYVDICYNTKYDKIFLLYSGKYRKEDAAQYGNIIYVLDNHDKVIAQYNLNEDILKLRISEDGGAFFGLTNTQVIKYEPELLRVSKNIRLSQ